MRVKKCCFCIPVAFGVKILGALDILSLLNSIVKGDVFGLFLLLAPAVFFVLMLINDCKRNRMLFFLAFAFYRTVLLCLFGYKLFLDFYDEPILDE